MTSIFFRDIHLYTFVYKKQWGGKIYFPSFREKRNIHLYHTKNNKIWQQDQWTVPLSKSHVDCLIAILDVDHLLKLNE